MSVRSLAPRRSCSSSSLLALAALASLAALGGCSPDKGPGSLVVDYVLGNNKMCAELGIDRVEVRAYQGTLAEPTAEYEDTKLCNDDNEVELTEITPGIYAVSVVGYDDAGVAIFDNLGQSQTERTVEVFEAAETTTEAELTARPAQLRIAWRLGEGGFGNCSGVGIDRFEVTAYEEGGGTVLLETVLDCELPPEEGENYRLVPDPDRALNGTRFGEVGIQALDASGNSVGVSAAFAFAPPGAGYPVELNIECTDMGCVEQP
jgi:hypothetical protein